MMEIILLLAIIVPTVIMIFYFVNRRTKKAEMAKRSDTDWINDNHCPSCHGYSLIDGPSGLMSQNVACGSCHEEFVIYYGLGTGCFAVDRLGKINSTRGSIYGIKLDM